MLEVGEVVSAEDGVGGKLGTERVEVACGRNGRLQVEDDRHGFLERWLSNDFAAGSVKHFLLG